MSARAFRLMTPAVLLLALCTALPLAAQKSKAKEPTYDDKPLSFWIKELKATAPQSRNAAAYAISGMGAEGKPAVPALMAALSNPTEQNVVRFPILVALREIGPDGKAALPAIEPFLDDRNDEIAAMARKAVKSITGTDPRPPADD